MPPKDYGRYTLLKKLATGGMAEVFLARQKGLEGFQKLCVIKRILPHLADDAEFVTMFLNEAKIAARFGHPNIAQIFDLGKEENTYYIAMEFVHGEDLGRIMRQAWSDGTWLPLPIALRIVAQACEGLHYAHSKIDERGQPLKVVHRDVSPQNVLVSFEGSAKIVDFGIARAADQASTTRSGAIKGKFAYMSPEQASGRVLDHRSDQFAVGLVLYEILTGVRPFKRDSDILTLKAAVDCEIPPPSAVAEVPRDLDPVVMRALSRVADDRYPDTRGFQLALDGYIVQQGWTVTSAHVAEFMHQLFQDRLDREEQLGEPIIHGVDSATGPPASGSFPLPKKVPTRSEFMQPPAGISGSGAGSLPEADPLPEVVRPAWDSEIRPAAPKRRATSAERPSLVPDAKRQSLRGAAPPSEPESVARARRDSVPPGAGEPRPRRSSKVQPVAAQEVDPAPVEARRASKEVAAASHAPVDVRRSSKVQPAAPPTADPEPDAPRRPTGDKARTSSAERKRRSVLYMSDADLVAQDRERAAAVKPSSRAFADDEDEATTAQPPPAFAKKGLPRWPLVLLGVGAAGALAVVPGVRDRALALLQSAQQSNAQEKNAETALYLDANVAVEVFQGETRLGTTPLQNVLVKEGPLTLRLVNPNLGIEREIKLQARGSTLRHREQFSIGRVRFKADKTCEVFIGGKRVAQAPGPLLDYFEGDYDVECRNEAQGLVGRARAHIVRDRAKIAEIAFKLGPMDKEPAP